MKRYEKKSLLTSFFLFFIPLVSFAAIVLFMYHQDRVKYIKENILYQMKDYTFDFKGDKFSLDIVENKNDKKTFKLYKCKEGLCAYFQPPTKALYLLKVVYEKQKYHKIYKEFLLEIYKIAFIIFVVLFILSILFAIYSMRPMKEALNLLENFLKDLIHDLNTPATSILLNTKLLKRHGNFDEIERIELSAKTISSLYKNLEFINPNQISKDDNVDVKELIDEKITVLKKLYPKISISNNIKELKVKSNLNGVDRIIDNILTNACKYNNKKGEVYIYVQDKQVVIEDTGIGIKNIKNVFQRYYKENENGLGIGMSIVKQLCDILDIDIYIESEVSKGTKVRLKFL